MKKAEGPHHEVEVVAQEQRRRDADGVEGREGPVGDQVPGLRVVGEVFEEIEVSIEVPAVEDQTPELDREKNEGDGPKGARLRGTPGNDPTPHACPAGHVSGVPWWRPKP